MKQPPQKTSKRQKRKSKTPPKKNFGKFYLMLLPIILLIGIWQGWSWWSWSISPPLQNTGEDQSVQVYIPPGTTNQEIGEDLAAAKVIRSYQAWKIWLFWLKITKQPTNLKAGTYQLSPTQPLPEILSKLMSGSVTQVNFTIPEGWSLKQMAAYFAGQGFFSAEDFLKAASEIPVDQYPWLPAGLPHLEGFLYPDTYRVASDQLSSPQKLIKVMLDRFQQIALPVYEQQRANSNLNLLQWVTLSSIVEKEAVIGSERPLIAGVFVNRLAKGMRLESDPTVEYGLGIKQTADQPLTLNQVRTDSPYNTYRNPGLPPTPIAAPGLSSLKATLAPDRTDYLFFVAKYDGTHVFSRNLRDHTNAMNQIRQQRRSR